MRDRQFVKTVAGYPAVFTLHIDDQHHAIWTIQYCGHTTETTYNRFIENLHGKRWLIWARNHPRP